eukprot:gene4975-biopygen1054
MPWGLSCYSKTTLVLHHCMAGSVAASNARARACVGKAIAKVNGQPVHSVDGFTMALGWASAGPGAAPLAAWGWLQKGMSKSGPGGPLAQASSSQRDAANTQLKKRREEKIGEEKRKEDKRREEERRGEEMREEERREAKRRGEKRREEERRGEKRISITLGILQIPPFSQGRPKSRQGSEELSTLPLNSDAKRNETKRGEEERREEKRRKEMRREEKRREDKRKEEKLGRRISRNKGKTDRTLEVELSELTRNAKDSSKSKAPAGLCGSPHPAHPAAAETVRVACVHQRQEEADGAGRGGAGWAGLCSEAAGRGAKIVVLPGAGCADPAAICALARELL